MLNKVVNDNSDEWEIYIQRCLFAYRTTQHSSTKYTPAELLFGKNLLCPFTNNPNASMSTLSIKLTTEEVDKYMNNRKTVDSARLEKAYANIESAQIIQKNYYDQRHKVVKGKLRFKPGDKVLLKRFRRVPGIGTVHQQRYHGPHEIVRYTGKGNYKMIDIVKRTSSTHNQRNIKPYLERRAHSPKKHALEKTQTDV